MGHRGRRKNRRSKGLVNDGSDSISDSLGPVATSSPELVRCDDQEDLEEILNARLMALKNYYQKGFDDIISTIDPQLLEVPFSFSLNCFEKLMNECASNQEENDTAVNSENEKVGDFKASSLPVRKIDKNAPGTSGSSRSVHWDSTVENYDPDEGVFKIPAKKKKNTPDSNKTAGFMAPNASRSNTIAGVIPGPLMSRNIRILRVPDAGETAVSLSGSPLLVTHLSNTGGPQVTVSIPDSGRLMAILPNEENEISPPNDNLFSGLEPNTKKQLKNLATLILNNIN